MQSLIDRARNIQLMVFDVDGVLTSGILSYDAQGIESKQFHVRDGQGIKLLKKTGIEIAIITACRSPIVARRMQDLGIAYLYQGQIDKIDAFADIKHKLKLEYNQIGYMGDDLPDLPMLCKVGFAVSVPSAPKVVQENVHWVTHAKGGKGAAREVCDFIMQAQGTYQSVIDAFLQRC